MGPQQRAGQQRLWPPFWIYVYEAEISTQYVEHFLQSCETLYMKLISSGLNRLVLRPKSKAQIVAQPEIVMDDEESKDASNAAAAAVEYEEEAVDPLEEHEKRVARQNREEKGDPDKTEEEGAKN